MNKLNMNENYIKYSAFSPLEKTLYCRQIYNFLRQLNIEYPGFSKWYNGLFLENMELKKGREIIICEKYYNIAGVAILKSTESENKICTLRVATPFQRQGIGSHLIKMSFEWLQDDKPLITMHKSKQHEFSSLLNHYGFVLEQAQWNYYNIFSTELSYNGILPPKKRFFHSSEIININTWYRDFLSSGKDNLADFIEECINNWFVREQRRQFEMITY